MPDRLAAPHDPESLFLSRGKEVNPNRPLYTGDVLEGVVLPVLDDERQVVIVVSHPCGMRAGPNLQPHLHVAPVVGHSESGPQMWTGNFKLMALDGLPVFTNPVARLDRATLVRSAELDTGRRIACLDRTGVNLLRQRLVHHLTRLVVNVGLFDQEAAPAHEEVDLMEEWLDDEIERGVAAADATVETMLLLQSLVTEDGAATDLSALVGQESVDVVDLLGLFEYFPEPLAIDVLRQARNLLKPGGILVLGNMLDQRPQQYFFSHVSLWPPLFQRSLSLLVRMIGEAGFDLRGVEIIVPPEGVYAVVAVTT